MKLGTLERLLDPLKSRVLGMVGRFVIQASTEANLQTLQVAGLHDEQLEDVERFQEYGFTSRPLPGAEAVGVFWNGNRSHGLIVATDDRRYRIKLDDAGDVAIYNDLGAVVKLGRDGIEIESPGKLTIHSAGDASLETDGVLTVDGVQIKLGAGAALGVARVGDETDDGAAIVEGSTKVLAE